MRRTGDGTPVRPEDARQELADAIGDTPLSALEARTVMWLYEMDQPTMHAIATLILKVRAEEPPTPTLFERTPACPDCGRSQGWNGHPYKPCGRRP